jgi:hypothetical protein
LSKRARHGQVVKTAPHGLSLIQVSDKTNGALATISEKPVTTVKAPASATQPFAMSKNASTRMWRLTVTVVVSLEPDLARAAH